MADSLPLSFPSLNSCAQAARTGPKVVPGVPVSAWRQGDKALRCGICAKKFGLLRWKHHCRACGDVCCRRCLGFCLVDVPEQGVDLAYTCARCVQKNTSKKTLVGDVNWPFPGDSHGGRKYPSRSADSFATMTMSDCAASPTPVSPCSFAWSLTPSSPRPALEYDVVVSQYRNQKLHSVCSLLIDYLDCIGGAIVLVQGQHLWVVAHKGLHSRVLRDPTFLSICSRALNSPAAFTVPGHSACSSPTGTRDSSTFQFFGVSPLFDVRESSGPALGCIVALDTRPRNAATSAKTETTLENLADHVMDLLAEEETILRIYASGDFKIFASNAVDAAPRTAPAASFDGFSSGSTDASSAFCSSTLSTRPRRSSSYASAEEFFNRSAARKADTTTHRKADTTNLYTSRSKQQNNCLRSSRSVSTLKAA